MSSWSARRDVDDADRVYGGENERTKSAMISEAEEVLLPQEDQQDHQQQPRFLLQQSSQKKSGYRLYDRFSKKALFIGQIVLFAIVIVQFIMLIRSYSLAAVAAARLVDAGVVRGKGADVGSDSAKSDLPDYLVTKPMLLPGEFCFPSERYHGIGTDNCILQDRLPLANLLSSPSQTQHHSHQRLTCLPSHWKLRSPLRDRWAMMQKASSQNTAS